jgi:hypothetical protein
MARRSSIVTNLKRIEALVQELHQLECAVQVFTPEQLRGVDAGELEEALVEPSAKILNDLRLELNGPDEVACANCDWTGQEDECNIPKRLWERMAPGDTYPAGECPECGALAFLIEETESV